MLAQSTSRVTEGARRTKRSRLRDDKSNQDEAANEKDARRNQVRPEEIYPPAGDPWNGKHERDDQDAFAVCDGKDGSEQDQRKQKR